MSRDQTDLTLLAGQEGHPFPKVCSRAVHQWLTTVVLATWEAEIRRIQFQASQGKAFPTLHLQNNQTKMEWRYGSSGRKPALQVQSPGFKLQYDQNEKV
jgi:hypothetical protein